MPSDSALIDQILAGDRSAYRQLVIRYERLAKATAMRSVHHWHTADDVAQEAFVAAFQSLSSLRDRSNFGAWLLGIVRRKAAHELRRSQRHRALSDEPLEDDSRSIDPESSELLELIERLPEHERLVIGLRHFQGHTTAEIADIIDRPVGTVTKQLSRAHGRLHQWLTEENDHERNEPSSTAFGATGRDAT